MGLVVYCSVLQWFLVIFSELQWVAVSCSELQWVVACCKDSNELRLGTQSADHSRITRLVVRCSALQWFWVSCSVLQSLKFTEILDTFREPLNISPSRYSVATISRLLQKIQVSFAKEPYKKTVFCRLGTHSGRTSVYIPLSLSKRDRERVSLGESPWCYQGESLWTNPLLHTDKARCIYRNCVIRENLSLITTRGSYIERVRMGSVYRESACERGRQT